MPADDLELGQAIEFEVDDQPIVVMVVSRLPQGETDGCTHIVEVVPTSSGQRRREERLRIDLEVGTVKGTLVGHALTPFWSRGFHLPPLPEHREHRCTDRAFLCVFLLSFVMFAWIVAYALRNGDLRELRHAVDYKGHICGVDIPEARYAFWCRRVAEDAVTLRYPICVTSCPTSNETQHLCVMPSDPLRKVRLPDYPTRVVHYSPYCWPVEGRKAQQVSRAYQRHMRNKGNVLLALPQNTLAVVPLAALWASIFGCIYFKLLERCVDFIVVVFVLGTTRLTFLVGIYELLMFWVTGEPAALAIGCFSILLGMLACRLFLTAEAKSALSMAAGCIEAACECINQEKSLLLEPVIAMATRVVFIFLCLTVLLLLVTTAAPSALREGQVQRNWHWTREQQFYMGYTIVWTMWLMELTTSVSQFALAWVTERWYFTPYVNDQKLDWERGEVLKSYAGALCKHLGTLAMGSLLILLMRIPRVLLRTIAVCTGTASDRRSTNVLCSCVASTCCFSCDYLYDAIAHINKNAYLGVALTSESFMRAAVSVHYMFNCKEEATPVSWLNGMQGIFQIGGLIVITVASGAATLLWVKLSNTFGPDVDVKDTVVFLSMVVAFPIGLSYMTLFDTVGDTILFCWAVQQRRYNYQKYRCCQMPVAVGFLSSYFAGADPEVGDIAKVNYAPPALRELVLGRHRKLALSCCPGGSEEL